MGVLDALGQFRGAVETKVRGPAMEARGRLLQRLMEEAEARKYQTDQSNQLAEQRKQGIGLAKQLNRSGLFNDPTAQTAVGLMSEPGSRGLGIQMAANLLDPAAQQQLANAKLSGQATQQGIDFGVTAEQRAVEQANQDRQKAAAFIANMSMDNASKAQGAQLEGLKFGLKNEADLRSEYTKAPLVQKGVQAISSWKMLDQALSRTTPWRFSQPSWRWRRFRNRGWRCAMMTASPTAVPIPVIEQLVQTYNTAVSGEGVDAWHEAPTAGAGHQLAGRPCPQHRAGNRPVPQNCHQHSWRPAGPDHRWGRC